MVVAAVAVIGKQNNPLYIRTFQRAANAAQPDADAATQLHYVVHAALDVIEERVAQKRGPQLQGLYLGLLYPTEEHGVYGYITNTKIKLVVVTEGDIEPSDNAVKQFLHQFHKLYIDTVCNPFHTLGAPLTSQRFATSLEQLLRGTLG